MNKTIFDRIIVKPLDDQQLHRLCSILGINPDEESDTPLDARITEKVSEDEEFINWSFRRLTTDFRPHVNKVVSLLQEALLEIVFALETEPDAIEEPDLTAAYDSVFDILMALTSGDEQEEIFRFRALADTYMKRAYHKAEYHLQYLDFLRERDGDR